MMLALVDGQRSYAQPKQVGHCELCGGIAIPKCGRINVWHWAHKTLEDCDTWSEPVTAAVVAPVPRYIESSAASEPVSGRTACSV